MRKCRKIKGSRESSSAAALTYPKTMRNEWFCFTKQNPEFGYSNENGKENQSRTRI